MDPSLEDMLLSDPRLLRAFLARDVSTRLDEQGRAIHWPVPRNSLEDIRAAYDALNDRNRVRASAMDWLLDQPGPVGTKAVSVGVLDWLPVTGGVTGAEDAYQSGRASGEALRRGDYGEAAAEGVLSLIGAGGAALSALPFVGMAGRGASRGIRRARGAAPQDLPRAAAEISAIGDASRSGYSIGDRLRAARAGGYEPPAGKPGLLYLPDEAVRFEARPVGPIEEAAAEYMRSRGVRDFAPLGAYPAFSEDRARAIAQAYADMRHDPQHPLVRRAYDAMIEETLAQYDALRDTGIDFRFLREGMEDPYARSPALGYRDIVENGRLYVFPTDFGFGSTSGFDPSSNPLLTRVGRIGDKPDAVANDAFRVVHDTFGHFGPGNPFFRHQGEERAWVEHSRMYSPEARGAMTSETRGQNSWLNFGPYGEQNRSALGADTVFADQKTGLMPEWTSGLLSPEDEQEIISLLLDAQRRGGN